jgi:hypothetical protein
MPGVAVAEPIRPVATLIAVGTFATALGNPLVLGSLPMKFVLKDQLAVSPSAMAVFFAAAGIAWYVKPLFAAWIDATGRKRGVGTAFFAAALAAVGLWIALALVPVAYAPLLGVFVAINVALVIVSSVIGGLLVENGQRHAATGRLTSTSISSRHVGYLIAGPLGGWLAAAPLGYTAAAGAALTGLLIATAYASRSHLQRVGASAPGTGIRELVRTKSVWVAAMMIFLADIAPGFETPLFYHQTDGLHLSASYIGWLQLASGAAGLLAAVAYALACRRAPLALNLAAFTLLCGAATLLYHFYSGPASALAVSIASGAATTLAIMPILDLAVRATPVVWACAGFALMMSVRNAASSLSDVLGSWLFTAHGVTFPELIWINAVTTAAVALVVPFLPSNLVQTREAGTLVPGPNRNALAKESTQ